VIISIISYYKSYHKQKMDVYIKPIKRIMKVQIANTDSITE
jgi:hypothetical protein